MPPAGRICLVDDDRIAYANQWIPEILVYDFQTRRPTQLMHWKDPQFRPQMTSVGRMPGAALLGVACARETLVVGYLVRETGELKYLWFDTSGAMLAAQTFQRDGGEFPGVPADFDGDLLLAYRNRPIPQVFVYRTLVK